MTISMYVDMSKFWWAYLGIKSNPALFSQMIDPSRHSIIFDHHRSLPSREAIHDQLRAKYFYIFWDGVTEESDMERVYSSLRAGADLTFLTVGDCSRAVEAGYNAQGLYPEGTLRFYAPALEFDVRTRAILLVARMRAALMPLRNILSNLGSAVQIFNLLVGRGSVVFCGSFGIIPDVLQQLCKRHSVAPDIFEGYQFYCNEPSQSIGTYLTYLRRNGLFLVDLYDRSQIPLMFFLSAVHLLGREYFIEKIRAASLDLFVNRYGSGKNVNVYTTPFYSQHTFIDFGSAVGPGNYPRLADLTYYRKRTVRINLDGEPVILLSAARAGSLETYFEREWDRVAPQLLRSN